MLGIPAVFECPAYEHLRVVYQDGSRLLGILTETVWKFALTAVVLTRGLCCILYSVPKMLW